MERRRIRNIDNSIRLCESPGPRRTYVRSCRSPLEVAHRTRRLYIDRRFRRKIFDILLLVSFKIRLFRFDSEIKELVCLVLTFDTKHTVRDYKNSTSCNSLDSYTCCFRCLM